LLCITNSLSSPYQAKQAERLDPPFYEEADGDSLPPDFLMEATAPSVWTDNARYPMKWMNLRRWSGTNSGDDPCHDADAQRYGEGDGAISWSGIDEARYGYCTT
jgi:hypothetical protein